MNILIIDKRSKYFSRINQKVELFGRKYLVVLFNQLNDKKLLSFCESKFYIEPSLHKLTKSVIKKRYPYKQIREVNLFESISEILVDKFLSDYMISKRGWEDYIKFVYPIKSLITTKIPINIPISNPEEIMILHPDKFEYENFEFEGNKSFTYSEIESILKKHPNVRVLGNFPLFSISETFELLSPLKKLSKLSISIRPKENKEGTQKEEEKKEGKRIGELSSVVDLSLSSRWVDDERLITLEMIRLVSSLIDLFPNILIFEETIHELRLPIIEELKNQIEKLINRRKLTKISTIEPYLPKDLKNLRSLSVYEFKNNPDITNSLVEELVIRREQEVFDVEQNFSKIKSLALASIENNLKDYFPNLTQLICRNLHIAVSELKSLKYFRSYDFSNMNDLPTSIESIIIDRMLDENNRIENFDQATLNQFTHLKEIKIRGEFWLSFEELINLRETKIEDFDVGIQLDSNFDIKQLIEFGYDQIPNLYLIDQGEIEEEIIIDLSRFKFKKLVMMNTAEKITLFEGIIFKLPNSCIELELKLYTHYLTRYLPKLRGGQIHRLTYYEVNEQIIVRLSKNLTEILRDGEKIDRSKLLEYESVISTEEEINSSTIFTTIYS